MHSLPKRFRGYFSTFIRLILPRSILEAFLHFIFCLTLCVEEEINTSGEGNFRLHSQGLKN